MPTLVSHTHNSSLAVWDGKIFVCQRRYDTFHSGNPMPKQEQHVGAFHSTNIKRWPDTEFSAWCQLLWLNYKIAIKLCYCGVQ